MKPVYRIRRKDKIWQILRPDHSVVNESDFKKLDHAERFLKTLAAMGYCEAEILKK